MKKSARFFRWTLADTGVFTVFAIVAFPICVGLWLGLEMLGVPWSVFWATGANLTIPLVIRAIMFRSMRRQVLARQTQHETRVRQEAAILAAYFGTWRPGDIPPREIVLDILGELPVGDTLAEIMWAHYEDGIVPPVLEAGSWKFIAVSGEIGEFCRRRAEAMAA